MRREVHGVIGQGGCRRVAAESAPPDPYAIRELDHAVDVGPYLMHPDMLPVDVGNPSSEVCGPTRVGGRASDALQASDARRRGQNSWMTT